MGLHVDVDVVVVFVVAADDVVVVGLYFHISPEFHEASGAFSSGH